MRNSRLDFLRFLGVALTMCNHLSKTGSSFFERILGKVAGGGWIGVDIFFVLSGFLVSGLIFKEYDQYQSFKPGNFLIRRGFKIYPVYYLFLLLSFFAALIFTNVFPPPSGPGLLHEAIFVSNYIAPYNNGLLWSICVEEHFYLFLSILFFLLIKYRKLNFKYIFTIYLTIFIATFLFRYQNYLQHSDYDFFRDYTRSHYRFDALFFGVLLFYIYNYHKPQLIRFLSSKLNYAFLIISLLYIAGDFVLGRDTHRWISVVSLGLHPLFFGCIILNFLEYKGTRIDKWIKPFAWVGMYSYSIYLFHGRINVVAFHFFSGYAYYISFFALSVLIGVFVSKIVEYPVLKFRDRYFPSRSKKLLSEKQNQLVVNTP